MVAEYFSRLERTYSFVGGSGTENFQASLRAMDLWAWRRAAAGYDGEDEMLSGTLLIGFVAAALVVLLIPGPGVMYVVARSVSQGHLAGFVSALGLSTGVLAHVAAAVVGLSAILLTSATAFAIVKYLGAAYLIYLGIQMLLAGHTAGEPDAVDPVPLSRLFADGVLVSVFNPKIAVFFLAFLPQFVDPSLGSGPHQILLLGLIYAGLALITDSAYGFLAGGLKQLLRGRVMRGPAPRYMGGGLMVGLGVKAALSGEQH